MIKLNGEIIDLNHFPDGTLHMSVSPYSCGLTDIEWYYENDAELFALVCLVRHIQSVGQPVIRLMMPYVPHSRFDRCQDDTDVFTLKYFCEIINSLNLFRVYILDPHSHVCEALLNNVCVESVDEFASSAIEKCNANMLFLPDEGAQKRYTGRINMPYTFGVKRRDWQTGKIEGLDVIGGAESITGKDVLIIDDICSRGSTFIHSAKKLKELGANKIYLYVTHCENTILEGELLTSGLIEKVYTTNSIFTKEHEKIEVFEV